MQNDKLLLLPCPFCGGEDVRFGSVGNSIGIDNYIKCNSCNAKIQICEEYGIEKLQTKWNTRKPMERIVEQLEEKSSLNHLEKMEERVGKKQTQGFGLGIRCAIDIVKGGVDNG